MAKTTKTAPQCCAQVQRHQITTIQRIALHKTGGCTRKGVVTMRRKDGTEQYMCRQHAKLALQGFVTANGEVMGSTSRSDYQTGKVGGLPLDFGLWTTDDPDLQHVADNFKQDMKIRRDAEIKFRARKAQRGW